MENLLKVLKANDYRSFDIMGKQMLEIISNEDLNSAQEGYRFNPIKNEKIEDWDTIIGEDYYVIGFETSLGDAILVDTSSSELPVYYIFNESWESIKKVASTFNEFIANLKDLDNRINNKHQCKNTIKKFTKSLDEKYSTAGFYETLCFDILDKDGLLYEKYNTNK